MEDSTTFDDTNEEMGLGLVSVNKLMVTIYMRLIMIKTIGILNLGEAEAEIETELCL